MIYEKNIASQLEHNPTIESIEWSMKSLKSQRLKIPRQVTKKNMIWRIRKCFRMKIPTFWRISLHDSQSSSCSILGPFKEHMQKERRTKASPFLIEFIVANGILFASSGSCTFFFLLEIPQRDRLELDSSIILCLRNFFMLETE